MKSYLITGASGFLGHHFIETLPQDSKLYLLTNQEKPYFPGREVQYLGLEELLSTRWEEGLSVVHFAARAHRMNEDPKQAAEAYHKTNCDLTLRLAQKAKEERAKTFLFVSSVKVMGNQPGSYDLGRQASPDEPYGASKYQAELGIEAIFSESDVRAINLRLPMVYGPGNKGNPLTLLKAAQKKVKLPLKGSQGKRSMIYIENLTDAIHKVLNAGHRPGISTYFVNDRHDLTSGEFYDLIHRAMHQTTGIFTFPEPLFRGLAQIGSLAENILNRKLPLNSGVASRLFDPYQFDASDFSKEFHWNPPFTPEKAVQKTVAWFLGQS